MNMDVYFISEEMLGDEATEGDARRMAELLTERGYDVEYGDSRRGQFEDEILTSDWDAALDIISEEKKQCQPD